MENQNFKKAMDKLWKTKSSKNAMDKIWKTIISKFSKTCVFFPRGSKISKQKHGSIMKAQNYKTHMENHEPFRGPQLQRLAPQQFWLKTAYASKLSSQLDNSWHSKSLMK